MLNLPQAHGKNFFVFLVIKFKKVYNKSNFIKVCYKFFPIIGLRQRFQSESKIICKIMTGIKVS